MAAVGSVLVGLAQTARIVLPAVGGDRLLIAVQVGVAADDDQLAQPSGEGVRRVVGGPRSRRPRLIDQSTDCAATLNCWRKKRGVRHWLTRLLISHLSVPRLGRARERGVAPRPAKTFQPILKEQRRGRQRACQRCCREVGSTRPDNNSVTDTHSGRSFGESSLGAASAATLTAALFKLATAALEGYVIAEPCSNGQPSRRRAVPRLTDDRLRQVSSWRQWLPVPRGCLVQPSLAYSRM